MTARESGNGGVQLHEDRKGHVLTGAGLPGREAAIFVARERRWFTEA